MSRLDILEEFDLPDRGRNLIRETSLVILIGFMMFLLMIFAIGFGEEIDAFFVWLLKNML